MAHVVKQPGVAYVTEWSHVLAARNVVHVARQEEVVGTVAVPLPVRRLAYPRTDIVDEEGDVLIFQNGKLKRKFHDPRKVPLTEGKISIGLSDAWWATSSLP